MQLGRHGTQATSAKLHTIDLSKAAAPFRYVTFLNYVLFLVGVFMVRDAAIHVLTTVPTRAEVTGRLIELAVGVYWTWTAIRDISVLSTVKSWNIYVALLLLGVPSLLGALWGGAYLRAHLGRDGFSSIGPMLMFVLFMVTGCSSLMALVALVRLQLARLPSGGMRLAHLLRDPAFQGRGGPRLPAQNAKAGIAYIAGALAILIGGGMINRFAAMLGDSIGIFSPVSLTAGYGALIVARQCFQPCFDTVQSSDQRAPVLFLRSFFDDVRMDGKKGERALLDFSLEARLANHFNQFGPFIAVGAPREANADLGAKTHLGAVRVQLADSEWQEKVEGWMDDSAFIVCMVGWSHWVTWEMKTVMERRHTDKLLLVFPDTALRGQSQTYDVEDRLARVHEALQGTAWEEAITAMGAPRNIRCLSLGPQGRVTAIVSRSRTRSAYELSALVGHAELLGLYGAATPEAETVVAGATDPVG
jgi:hypothetical protein